MKDGIKRNAVKWERYKLENANKQNFTAQRIATRRLAVIQYLEEGKAYSQMEKLLGVTTGTLCRDVKQIKEMISAPLYRH